MKKLISVFSIFLFISCGGGIGSKDSSGGSNGNSSAIASALCNDGTYSYSKSCSGTCSWHGGVREWYNSCGGSSSTTVVPTHFSSTTVVPTQLPPTTISPTPGTIANICSSANLKNVYAVNFDNNPDGIYSRALLYQDWGSALRSINGIDEGRVTVIQIDTNNKAISVLYPTGSCGPKDTDGCNRGSGAQWLMPLNNSYDELCLSYRVKFNEGFNFVRGGKLPGLTASPDPFATLPPTGGKIPGECDGFSARFMWKANGSAITYLYSPAQSGTYGDELSWKNNGGPVNFQTGRWYEIAQRIKMNTPGQHDGVIDVWLDGISVQHKDSIFLRGAACPDLKINQFYFSTFFGGNDYSYAAVKDEYTYFDDFLIGQP